MAFQRQEKKRKPHLLLTLSRNPGPGRCLLKKRSKRSVSKILKQKILLLTCLLQSRPKSRSRKAFLKKEIEKHV